MTPSIFWFGVTSFFKKVKKLCKKYWQILFGFFTALLAFLLVRENGSHKTLKKRREVQEKEISIISDAKEKEIEQHREASEKYVRTIKEVQKKYGDIQQDLDIEKKKRIVELIENSEDDSGAITDKIAEIMGFQKYN